MKLRDDLGTRMKVFYEEIPKTRLMRRTPVIIRIDGRAFHTFTKGFVRPFDEVFMEAMQKTTKYLCENIPGCVLGYCQSDEISLVLVDYESFDTSAWFDYEVQKLCSISASMATMAFNRFFSEGVKTLDAYVQEEGYPSAKTLHLLGIYADAIAMGAMFDARVFNIPKEEVTNCIYWRQLDASRNSIQMLGQAHFKQKELEGKSCSEIQDMLMLQKGINWNDLPIPQKRGTCVVRREIFVERQDLPEKYRGDLVQNNGRLGMFKTVWVIDKEIPIFKGEDREYIEKLVYVGEK